MPNQGGKNLVSPRKAAAEIEKALVGKSTPAAFKPEVFVPGASHTVTDAALALGRLLGRDEKYFFRGQTVVRVTVAQGHPSLIQVKSAALPSAFENVATIVKSKKVDGEWVSEPAIFPEPLSKQVLESDDFHEELPKLRVLCQCPVLVERDGGLVEVVGYDRRSGIYTSGKPTETVSLEVAKSLLEDVLREFHFATMADHARAMAAIITPAMVFSGLLKGRAPLDLGEADQSQTGKGFRNKITAAIYGQVPKTITQRKGGVGSLEESISTALIRGTNFISIDNLKGKLDSPALESLLTEDKFEARGLRMSEDIDVTRTTFQLTSNKADFTVDLANRASCVRLLKRASDHNFAEYPEGDILDHVTANQPRYLGAVFAVIRAWHAAGKPKTKETRHAFRPWVQRMDWIVQNLLDGTPLMRGHTATLERMTNPTMGWMRDVTILMRHCGKLDQWLRTSHIMDIIAESDVKVPGLKEDDSLVDPTVKTRVLQAIGRKLSIAFRQSEELEIDGMVAKKRVEEDFRGQECKTYRFEDGTTTPF